MNQSDVLRPVPQTMMFDMPLQLQSGATLRDYTLMYEQVGWAN